MRELSVRDRGQKARELFNAVSKGNTGTGNRNHYLNEIHPSHYKT